MSHFNLTLEIDLYKLLKLLPLALVVCGALEFAFAVKIVMKAIYSAEAAREAFKMCRKIGTFLVHIRIMAQGVIYNFRYEPDGAISDTLSLPN